MGLGKVGGHYKEREGRSGSRDGNMDTQCKLVCGLTGPYQINGDMGGGI